MSVNRSGTAAALVVWIVENTRWPVIDASAAMCAVSPSRTSPMKITSGSLRRIDRNATGNVNPAGGLIWICLRPFELILDRVFDRNDRPFRGVDLGQRRIQRRALARTGRTTHDDRALRRSECRLVALQLRGPKAQAGQRNDADRVVEKAQHHRLAVRARQRRDAHVDVEAVVRDREAAVLRHASLGDVEIGHDFQPADHRAQQIGGRFREVVEHAVDAHSQSHAIFRRFDVQIGGAVVDRLFEQRVDETHDRTVDDIADWFVEASSSSRSSTASLTLSATSPADVRRG